jgi:hypothetical protein
MTEITVARSPDGFKASLGKWKTPPPGWKYRPRSWASLTPAEITVLGVGDYAVGEWASIRFAESKLPELARRLQRVSLTRWYGGKLQGGLERIARLCDRVDPVERARRCRSCTSPTCRLSQCYGQRRKRPAWPKRATVSDGWRGNGPAPATRPHVGQRYP